MDGSPDPNLGPGFSPALVILYNLIHIFFLLQDFKNVKKKLIEKKCISINQSQGQKWRSARNLSKILL